MKKLASLSVLAIAGAVTTGLIALQTPASADEDAAFRKDDTPDVVMAVDDDDDDDTYGRDDDTRTNGQTRTNGGNGTNTGNSRSTRDNTNSRFTAVSRDRDQSRSDKTKDWTRDGGDRTRDHSANQTNDRSRNDTRR